MQVRAIEFQENFRLVTLEAARQLSVINREGMEGALRAAGVAAEQRLQDLHRPIPTDEPQSGRRIEEGESRAAGRHRDSEPRTEEDEEEAASEQSLPQGKSIDLFA